MCLCGASEPEKLKRNRKNEKTFCIRNRAVCDAFALGAGFHGAVQRGGDRLHEQEFRGCGRQLQKLIDEGTGSPEAADLVATAKATLPKCYFQLGGMAFKSQNFDEALANFEKSAELADLYGDYTQMQKSNTWVANIYQVQGGEAFNSKDYAAAAEIFAKGYAANPAIRIWRSIWR